MALKNKDIDMGHARSLLAIDSPSQQLKLFKEIQRNNYSVRKVEELVQLIKNGENLQQAKKTAGVTQLPLEFSILRDRLSELFKTKVTMTCSPEVKGKISINFSNEDELEFVMQVFDKVKKSQK
jgi:ParB family chromosome partitioning protein